MRRKSADRGQWQNGVVGQHTANPVVAGAGENGGADAVLLKGHMVLDVGFMADSRFLVMRSVLALPRLRTSKTTTGSGTWAAVLAPGVPMTTPSG